MDMYHMFSIGSKMCSFPLKADKYNVRDLVEDCEAALLKTINLENVVSLLNAACKVGLFTY